MGGVDFVSGGGGGGGQGSPLQNLSVVRDLHSENHWSWDLGPPIIMSLCS